MIISLHSVSTVSIHLHLTLHVDSHSGRHLQVPLLPRAQHVILFVLYCVLLELFNLIKTISVCKVPLGDVMSSSQSPWRAQFVHVLHAAELNPRMPPADKQEP